VLALLRFITIAVGRAQNVPVFTIDIGADEATQGLEVHWSHHPKRSSKRADTRSSPQPHDLPLDPINRPDEFLAVLKSWLAGDQERRAARVRADDSFTRQTFYPIDRLVGAANAFDLLPESAVPDRVGLTAEVLAAKKQCKAIFRELPNSDERESLLRALGRLGQVTLKQKIRHRANIITRATGNDYFQSLDFCRLPQSLCARKPCQIQPRDPVTPLRLCHRLAGIRFCRLRTDRSRLGHPGLP
jgi:hypothetical protein